MIEAAAETLQRRVLLPAQIRRPRRIEGRVAQLGGMTMGTTWSVKLVASPGVDLERLRQGVEAELALITAQMSAWEPASLLSRFNAAPPGTSLELPAEFCAVLDCALRVAAETEGAYDPTIGSLVNLWGFGPAGRTGSLPQESAVALTTRPGGWRSFVFDRGAGILTQPGGITLDVCAIAKGYAVDRVAAFLRKSGCRNALVEIGGELRGEGVKPDGSPWWVAIDNPHARSSSEEQIVVALHHLSIATSGDHQRQFRHGRMRYSHLIDPRNGRPVSGALRAVTVIHAECMAADAYSTALMVMGIEEGMAFASARNLQALFLVEEGDTPRWCLSPALSAMLA